MFSSTRPDGTTYAPEFQYTLDEYMEHFEHFIVAGTKDQAKLMSYFGEHYRNRAEGLYKRRRFQAALFCIISTARKPPASFDRFLVMSESRKGLVSEPLVVACWRMFAHMPQEVLDKEFPPGVTTMEVPPVILEQILAAAIEEATPE